MMKWQHGVMGRIERSFFIMTLFMPASLSVVFIIPPGTYTSFLGATNTTFKCTSHEETLRSVHWYLNGSRLDDLNLTQIWDTPVSSTFGYSLLVFGNMTQRCNETRVSCSAVVNTGQTRMSGDVLLLVQGYLSQVESLSMMKNQSFIFLTWSAPPSLDITGISGYCVDVIGTSKQLRSECNISETEFSYPKPPRDWSGVLLFRVWAQNVVGNGTAAVLPYFLVPNCSGGIAAALVSDGGDGVDIVTVFCDESEVSGVLLSFVFLNQNGSVDASKCALLVLDSSQGHRFVPFQVHRGRYQVHVYDIGPDRVLSSTVLSPALTDCLYTTEDGTASEAPLNVRYCSVNSNFAELLIGCVFHDNTTATAYQVIVLNIADGSNQLITNQSTDLQSSVQLRVGAGGLYQLSVLPVTEEFGILKSKVEYVQQVIVDVGPTAHTVPQHHSPLPYSTPAPTQGESSSNYTIPLVVVGVVLLFSVAVIVLLAYTCVVCRRKHRVELPPVSNVDEEDVDHPGEEEESGTDTCFLKNTSSSNFPNVRRTPDCEDQGLVTQSLPARFSQFIHSKVSYRKLNSAPAGQVRYKKQRSTPAGVIDPCASIYNA